MKYLHNAFNHIYRVYSTTYTFRLAYPKGFYFQKIASLKMVQNTHSTPNNHHESTTKNEFKPPVL